MMQKTIYELRSILSAVIWQDTTYSMTQYMIPQIQASLLCVESPFAALYLNIAIYSIVVPQRPETSHAVSLTLNSLLGRLLKVC